MTRKLRFLGIRAAFVIRKEPPERGVVAQLQRDKAHHLARLRTTLPRTAMAINPFSGSLDRIVRRGARPLPGERLVVALDEIR